MFTVSRLGDLATFYIGVFLVPAVIAQDQLGAIIPLTKLSGTVAIALTIILGGALKYINVFHNAGRPGKIKTMLKHLAWLSLAVSSLMLLLLWTGREFIQERLKFESPVVILLIGGIAILSCWSPMANTAAQSLKRFNSLIALKIVQPVTRLLMMLLLLAPFQIAGYLGAQLIAALAGLLLVGRSLFRFVRPGIRAESYREDLPQLVKYVGPFGLMTLTVTLQGAVEPWVIRQRLPDIDSAGFFIISMFGNIPLWVAPAMLPFLFPLVSEKFERGESTQRMYKQSLAAVFFIGIAISIFFFFAAEWILSLQHTWRIYHGYAGYMWQMGLVNTLFVLINTHIMHENACRIFGYLRYYLPVTLAETFILYVIWDVKRIEAFIPEPIFLFIRTLTGHRLAFIIGTMLLTRLIVVLFIVKNLLWIRKESARRVATHSAE